MLRTSTSLLIGIKVMLLVSCAQSGDKAHQSQSISGPYTHENLSVFFVHSDATPSGGDLLTLSEALESGKIEVIETGSVGELQIENLCNEPIFIQAGDIVKGGRQDRVLQYDIVVKPKSGRVPVKSFCVEQGRWSARGKESVARFETSDKALASKDLKLAAKSRASQSDVWDQVAEVQSYIVRVVGESVADEESPTSLQLTLENDKLQERISTAIQRLTASLGDFDNVVGFAFTINGEINSADIYSSPTLFSKMWPKLIEAAATEAVANTMEDSGHLEVTPEDIDRWLASSGAGATTNQDLGNQVHLQVTDSDENVVFETKLEDGSSCLIHKNVIKK